MTTMISNRNIAPILFKLILKPSDRIKVEDKAILAEHVLCSIALK